MEASCCRFEPCLLRNNGCVTQLVEYPAFNRRVKGSSPFAPSLYMYVIHWSRSDASPLFLFFFHRVVGPEIASRSQATILVFPFEIPW